MKHISFVFVHIFRIIYMISAYHPFYITDDKEGGYQYKTTSQRRKTKVFSGIENNRLSGATPTGIGRLCEWREDPQQPADSFSSFGAYQVIKVQRADLTCDAIRKVALFVLSKL